MFLVMVRISLSYWLDANKFIATNTRLCDIFSLEALIMSLKQVIEQSYEKSKRTVHSNDEQFKRLHR